MQELGCTVVPEVQLLSPMILLLCSRAFRLMANKHHAIVQNAESESLN